MLVTFSCPAHADITMFGDVATRLIKMMGHSGTVPSAIPVEAVPAALERISKNVTAEDPQMAGPEFATDSEEEPAISLRLRAGPLLELLEAAKSAKCNVMWHQS